MKLSTLLEVIETLYEKRQSPLGNLISDQWDVDLGSVEHFRTSANAVFRFMMNRKRYYLRFNKSTERELTWIKSEIEVLKALNKSTVKVNQPVHSRSGNLVETVDTKWGTFYAVVFEGLPGYEWDPDQLTDQQLKLWGAAVGQFHEASAALPESIVESRWTWRSQLDWVKSWLDPDDEAAHDAWTQITTWANGLEQNKGNFGLIHTDLELDNIRWVGNQFGILDMDECQQHWYVMDIWQAISDLTDEQINFEHPKVQLFLTGYREHYSLDETLWAQLPMFKRMNDLVKYAVLRRSLSDQIGVNEPEWSVTLREKLQVSMKKHRDDLLKE